MFLLPILTVLWQVPVAIKTLNQQHLVSGTEGFMREAQVMVRLDHPCIVKLIGICQGPPLMLVSLELFVSTCTVDQMGQVCWPSHQKG